MLDTARLHLRPLTRDDVPGLHAFLSDPLTMVHYPVPFDVPAVERWVDRATASYAANGYGLWAVVLRETGELIGDCGFLVQSVHGRTEAELSYHFARTHWGQGYATEAALACRDHAFGTLGLERLISLILPVHTASQGVARRVGLQHVGETTHNGMHHRVYALERGRTARKRSVASP